MSLKRLGAFGCLLTGLLWAGTAGAMSITPATGVNSSDLGYLNVFGGINFSDTSLSGGLFTDVFTLTNTGAFALETGPYGPGNALTTTVALHSPPPATIDGLVVSWYQGAFLPVDLIASQQVTDASGNAIGPGTNGDGALTVAVAPNITYFLVLTGTASSFLASFSGSITPTSGQGSVPLPAALLLFGTVLSGAGMFMRRRRGSAGQSLAAA